MAFLTAIENGTSFDFNIAFKSEKEQYLAIRAIFSYKSNNYMRSKTENFMKSNREKVKKNLWHIIWNKYYYDKPKLLRILGAQIFYSRLYNLHYIIHEHIPSRKV